MTIDAWLGNTFWQMLHNFWWLWTRLGFGGAELFIRASCSSVCSVCIWRTHSCGVGYMFPHRSHLSGGKSLPSSSESPWKKVWTPQCISPVYFAPIFNVAGYALLNNTHLSFSSSIFRHVSVCELYVTNPVGRSVESLTAHVACKGCVLLFLHVAILIRAVHYFLQINLH